MANAIHQDIRAIDPKDGPPIALSHPKPAKRFTLHRDDAWVPFIGSGGNFFHPIQKLPCFPLWHRSERFQSISRNNQWHE